MIQILLIISLAIAILFDAVRIIQYVQLRKSQQNTAKELFRNKLTALYYQWADEEGIHGKQSVIEYIIKHWEDETTN